MDLYMALPLVSHPTVPLLVPSKKRAYRFRPFTVKEEKILLMAKESDEPKKDQLRAIHQVVGNCSTDPQLDIDDLAEFDLEWLYLKLTSLSVGPTVTQAFIDKEDREVLQSVSPNLEPEPYVFTINLEDVHAPVLPDDWTGSKVISMGDPNGQTQSVTLIYPPASLYIDPLFSDDATNQVLYKSTKYIVSGPQTFHASEFTKEEVIEYYDSWQTKDMTRVWEFLNSAPTMKYELVYTNKQGSERRIVLSSLTDFFPF